MYKCITEICILMYQFQFKCEIDYTYLRRTMRQMHITNTSSPSRTAAPTAPATTDPVGTPVLSGVASEMNVELVVLPVASLLLVVVTGLVVSGLVASGLVVTGLVVTGLVVTGLVASGLVVTGLVASGLVVEGLIESVVKGLIVKELLVEGLVMEGLLVAPELVVEGLVMPLVQRASSAISVLK